MKKKLIAVGSAIVAMVVAALIIFAWRGSAHEPPFPYHVKTMDGTGPVIVNVKQHWGCRDETCVNGVNSHKPWLRVRFGDNWYYGVLRCNAKQHLSCYDRETRILKIRHNRWLIPHRAFVR